MKKELSPVIIFAILLVTSCSTTRMNTIKTSEMYKPDSQELYNTIVKLDSVFFDAYNTCKIDVQAAFYSDSIEFYHDQGGLSTSKKDILEGTKKNICGKVTRELVKGSIEVYPINGYGAVEFGLHKFHNNTQTEDAPSRTGKFVIIWQYKDNNWKIKRVISLH
jgi:hypothetical protein